jgi:hypothetical protein
MSCMVSSCSVVVIPLMPADAGIQFLPSSPGFPLSRE